MLCYKECWNESSKLKCSPDMFPIHCVEPGELLHVVQARDPDWQGINITETVNFVKTQIWHLQWKIDFGARWSLTIECWQQIAPRGDDGRMSKAVEDPWWLDVDNCWHEPWVGSVAKPLDGLSGRPVHIMGWVWQLEMNWKKVGFGKASGGRDGKSRLPWNGNLGGKLEAVSPVHDLGVGLLKSRGVD